MTSTLNSTRMTVSDQAELPLIADVAFNEMFTSSALNRKFLGIVRPGIYRGFKYKIGTGLKLIIGDDSGKNTAYVERDGYTMTIQGQHAQTMTLPAGRRSAIVLEGFYEYGVKTRQVDKTATVDSAVMKVIPSTQIAEHHTVVYEVNIPIGATQITEAMIIEENRLAGGIDIQSHIDVTKDPHQQYALRARRINTSGPLRGGRDLHDDVNLTIDTATTARLGVVKLYDSSDSTSTTLGVTANALKKERDRAQAVENTKYNKSGGTISGNVVVDNGTTTSLTVKANDNGNAEIAAYGDVSGTGRLYVGQSQTYGGGIEYNGDSNPVTSESGSDYLTLFRRTNGINQWTARNFHSNNDWEFRGDLKTGGNITIGGGSSTVDRLLNLQGFNAAQIGMWATEDEEKHGAFFGYHGTSDSARIAVKNNGAVRDVWRAERATGKGTFNFQQTFAGGIVSNGDIVATSGKRVVLPSGDNYDKLNLWGGASTFAIGMHAGERYGWLNDHAMTFTMNNVASRGWLWRTSESTADQGAMSLTTDGRLMVGHRIGFANNQTTWMQDGGSSIRIVSPYGYMNIGSTNENWAHFTTDRKGYYFDKPIHVNGMIGSYSDNDLQLHRGGSVRFELKSDRNVSNQKLVAPLFQVGNANSAGQLYMGSTEDAKPRIFQTPFRPDASGPDWTKEFGFDHSKAVDGVIGVWYFDTDVLIRGSKVWHAANDGAGSGLDADLLDGYQAAHFPRKAESAKITGDWSHDGKLTLNTKEGAKPLEITRLGSPSETLSIWRTDTTAIFQISEDQSESDQSLGTFLFQGRQEVDAPDPVAFLSFNQTYIKYLGQHVYHDGYHPIADRWSTPRTLTLTGDLSGSVSIDGSGDVSLSASVANNSHTHDSLEISDTRASARSPNDLPTRTLYPQFTNQDGPFDGAWASKISVKGWTNDYGVWELAAGSNSTKQYGLHFRTGLGTAWEKWERVFTSEYHPNADKLTTARTISLGGDLTGSVAFDGSANVTISAAVKDNSHLHTIANVTGLQTALTSAEGNAKAYTDSRISELLGGAPAAALDTIKELGDALMDNDSDIAAINATLATKLDKTGKAADSNKLDGLDSLAFGQLAKAQTWTGLNTFNNGQINLTSELQLSKSSTKSLRIGTTSGYIDIGAQNTSYAHIYTDRPSFYLNKEIRVLGNKVFHDNYHPNADKLTTARTITLGGDLMGSVSFDGSDNVTLNAEVKSDSHTHDATTVRSMAISEGSVTRLQYPKGASFQNRTNTVVGAIQISLPVMRTSTMMQMEVAFFDFTRHESFTLIISGYNYSAGWMNVTATINGSSVNREFKVRFGNDGTKDVIIIGEVDSTWSYPAVAINEVLLSYGNISISTWYQGWDIKLITELPANIDDETTTVLPVSSIATKLRTARTIALGGDLSGSVAFDGSANVTLSAAVKDNSHLHTLDNVTGLSDALNARLPREVFGFSGHYSAHVILLIPYYTDTKLSESEVIGRFTLRRGGSASTNRTTVLDVVAKSAYNKNSYAMSKIQADGWDFRLGHCQYAGKRWLCLYTPSGSNDQECRIEFWGTRSMNSGAYDASHQFKVIAYHNTENGVLNAEIKDSLTGLNAPSLGDANGDQFFSPSNNNIGTGSTNYAAGNHGHDIVDVTGLQAALDAKMDKAGGAVTGVLTVEGQLIVGKNRNHVFETSSGMATYRVDNPNGWRLWLNTLEEAAITVSAEGKLNAHRGILDNGSRVFSETYHPNADKLTTGRTITVGGDATGSVVFDGSKNVTLNLSSQALRDGTHTVEGASNLAAGWYTIAVNTGSRAIGRFGLKDNTSGKHQSVTFYASHQYGKDTSNFINVLQNTSYGTAPLTQLRIKEGLTYDGAALQVFVEAGTSDLKIYLLGDNYDTTGWRLVDWLPDSAVPPGLTAEKWGSMAPRTRVDLNVLAQGSGTNGNHTLMMEENAVETRAYRIMENNKMGAWFGYSADANRVCLGATEDGTDFLKMYSLRGNAAPWHMTGNLYLNSNADGSGGGSRVFADNYHPNADKLTTARTINLGGDLTGSVSFDGTANVTLSASIKDDSHYHHLIRGIDDRDVKPTDVPYDSLRAYFTSAEGLNGAAGTTYQDFLVLNTYTDTSGGHINGLAFDKKSQKIRHYWASKDATVWGTAQVIAYESSNVASANKLKTARTISLGGDLSGSANFDGSANISITATVKDDSHAHIISNIDGLQSALDGKANKTNAVLAGTRISMPNMGEGMSFVSLTDNRHNFNDIRQINLDDANAPTDGAILFTADKAAKGDGLVDIFLLSRTSIRAFQKITGTITEADNAQTLGGRGRTGYIEVSSKNTYPGLAHNGDDAGWIRTTSNGLLPFNSGGNSSLGTSAWPFQSIYGKAIYDDGVLLENKYIRKNAIDAFTHTASIGLPKGTTAQRGTAGPGRIRFNTELNRFEGHDGTEWGEIGGGAAIKETFEFGMSDTPDGKTFTLPSRIAPGQVMVFVNGAHYFETVDYNVVGDYDVVLTRALTTSGNHQLRIILFSNNQVMPTEAFIRKGVRNTLPAGTKLDLSDSDALELNGLPYGKTYRYWAANCPDNVVNQLIVGANVNYPFTIEDAGFTFNAMGEFGYLTGYVNLKMLTAMAIPNDDMWFLVLDAAAMLALLANGDSKCPKGFKDVTSTNGSCVIHFVGSGFDTNVVSTEFYNYHNNTINNTLAVNLAQVQAFPQSSNFATASCDRAYVRFNIMLQGLYNK